jgi:hypothetical protein
MDVLVQVVVWLNDIANALAGAVLAPVAALPGWLSATLIATVTGVLLLVVFKYTSNQKAIKQVRNDIKANLFALKLFKDNVAVTFRAQGRLLLGALRLFVLAIVPMLIMTGPVVLLMGQMALWYQARPLRVGEDALIVLTLNPAAESSLQKVRLIPSNAIAVAIGPVRVVSKGEVYWKITAREAGFHHLAFDVDGQTIEKELAIGDGFMRVSMERPKWDLLHVLENPSEPPFDAHSSVQSIQIEYPPRSSWTSGTDWWMGYWFIVSMIAAFAFRGLLKVNI